MARSRTGEFNFFVTRALFSTCRVRQHICLDACSNRKMAARVWQSEWSFPPPAFQSVHRAKQATSHGRKRTSRDNADARYKVRVLVDTAEARDTTCESFSDSLCLEYEYAGPLPPSVRSNSILRVPAFSVLVARTLYTHPRCVRCRLEQQGGRGQKRNVQWQAPDANVTGEKGWLTFPVPGIAHHQEANPRILLVFSCEKRLFGCPLSSLPDSLRILCAVSTQKTPVASVALATGWTTP